MHCAKPYRKFSEKIRKFGREQVKSVYMSKDFLIYEELSEYLFIYEEGFPYI